MLTSGRSNPSEALLSAKVLAVLRARDASAYEAVVAVLSEVGIASIELTLTTPGTIEALPYLVSSFPQAEFGVGTVLKKQDASAAIQAGAQFLVSPTVNSEVIETAVSQGIPIYPGALTPAEVEKAWDLGATAVKLFPAETVGPAYVKHLSGPFPGIRTIPSGGVALTDVAKWIQAGSFAVSLGGPLLGDALRGGDLTGLRTRAKEALIAASEVKAS